jgi:hypothetical protein
MKTTLLSISLFFCGIAISPAQEQTVSEVNLTTELKTLCKLNADQLAKVGAIVADFEKKRDATYKKYKHNVAELKKLVKQNRWDYEIALIGTLNPSQMGLLKVFDQRNPQLMAHASTEVNDVSYFAESDNTVPEQTVSEPVVTNEPKTQPVAEVVSADQPKGQADLIFKLIRQQNDHAGLQSTLSAKSENKYIAESNSDFAQVQFANEESSATALPVLKNENKATPIPEPVLATNASNEQTSSEKGLVTEMKAKSAYEINITDELKDLCNLSPEQLAKVDPIVSDFEKNRDEIYKKCRHNPTLLAKMVKKNRWDYEVSLIGTLNPSQMGLLKVFDQRNPELMTFNSGVVNDVSYFADSK